MPSTGSSGPWTFSELLGQPRLLGLGALLAWLVLFHLLVNVWLLCVFTSLLVVLGGWLGSRALLDANSLLHLEHFLPVGGVNPPPPSPEHEWRLNHELHSAVHKAVRDFVSSWYRTLLPEVEGDFERVVRNTMLEAVMELKERARRVDRKLLVQRLLELYGSHLQSYMTARHIQAAHEDGGSLWQLYRGADAPHPAVSRAATELSYSRALVNLVLHVLVPYPHMESRTGGYVVTELITCNLLMPLISRVSDPDWLNQIIVDVFARSREPQGVRVDELPAPALYACQVQPESWTTCRSPSASEPPDAGSTCESQSAACECDSESSGVSLASAERMENCHSGLLTPCKVKCCLLASGHCSPLTRSEMVSVESVIQSDSEDDIPEGFCDCGPPTNLCNRITSKDDEAFGCFGPLKSLGPKVVVSEDAQWPAGMAQERSPTCPPRRTPLSPCSGGTPGGPAAPVRVHNVHIAGTVTAKDQRGSSAHPCTLYTIKFDAVAEAGDGALCRRRTVHRRYSEFLNLQTRLEENLEVKRLLKNVKGPKKMFPDLPFGNADNERVEARKGQLDTFLKQLSSIPETAHSEDMHEFLALSSDPAAYFERKPVVKSKIDKMMENALDTLKTAFPHPELLSPTEELDAEGDGRAMDSRRYRRLMFPSKVSPSLNIPDLHPKVTYCFSEGSRVLNGMSMSGLESFIKEQERLMCEENGKDVVTRSCERPKTPGKTHGTDTAVADVALNILCLLMKDQWSWLCTENIQKTIRLLFGTFIERWLDIGVAHLTSASCWVIYLQVLQETVWPGGTLPVQPRPERSAAEREETKEQCLNCLMQLLPELVTDMLGSEKYRLSAETMLESLQDCQINKHLIYCVCDLLLELLVPESCDELSQKSLPQSLAKDSERNSSYR